MLPAQASRLASRYTKAGKLASLPAFLPTQPYRWHRAIPKQANLRLLCFPPNHRVLHRAIPKQANLQVCLLSFPPNHSVLHPAIPKQATLRVCVPSFPPNHTVWHARDGENRSQSGECESAGQEGTDCGGRLSFTPALAFVALSDTDVAPTSLFAVAELVKFTSLTTAQEFCPSTTGLLSGTEPYQDVNPGLVTTPGVPDSYVQPAELWTKACFHRQRFLAHQRVPIAPAASRAGPSRLKVLLKITPWSYDSPIATCHYGCVVTQTACRPRWPFISLGNSDRLDGTPLLARSGTLVAQSLLTPHPRTCAENSVSCCLAGLHSNKKHFVLSLPFQDPIADTLPARRLVVPMSWHYAS